jgi:CRISPR/Cas system endoribonuclease Cas6 (RAMP superfamily)
MKRQQEGKIQMNYLYNKSDKDEEDKKVRVRVRVRVRIKAVIRARVRVRIQMNYLYYKPDKHGDISVRLGMRLGLGLKGGSGLGFKPG